MISMQITQEIKAQFKSVEPYMQPAAAARLLEISNGEGYDFLSKSSTIDLVYDTTIGKLGWLSTHSVCKNELSTNIGIVGLITSEPVLEARAVSSVLRNTLRDINAAIKGLGCTLIPVGHLTMDLNHRLSEDGNVQGRADAITAYMTSFRKGYFATKQYELDNGQLLTATGLDISISKTFYHGKVDPLDKVGIKDIVARIEHIKVIEESIEHTVATGLGWNPHYTKPYHEFVGVVDIPELLAPLTEHLQELKSALMMWILRSVEEH